MYWNENYFKHHSVFFIRRQRKLQCHSNYSLLRRHVLSFDTYLDISQTLFSTLVSTLVSVCTIFRNKSCVYTNQMRFPQLPSQIVPTVSFPSDPTSDRVQHCRIKFTPSERPSADLGTSNGWLRMTRREVNFEGHVAQCDRFIQSALLRS